MAAATVTARERGGLRPERRALTREQAQGLIGAARRLGGDPGSGSDAGSDPDPGAGAVRTPAGRGAGAATSAPSCGTR
ncbi:hypothetical protein [Planomonospora algeriensis]